MTTSPPPEKKKWSAMMVGALLLIAAIGILIVMIATGGLSPLLQHNPPSQEGVPAAIPASITPSTGDAGLLVPVTIEGKNFTYGMSPAVWLSKPGAPDIPAIDVMVISPTRLTCTFPLTGSSVSHGQYDVLTRNADEQTATSAGVFTVLDEVPPSLTWNWSADRWEGWHYGSSCTRASAGTAGSCQEYGPVIVNGHGEYGSNVTFDRIPIESYVERTFAAPSGTRWRNLTFTGQLSSTSVPYVRWIAIDVNGKQVFSANATQTPPGNGRQFTITQSFSPANQVMIRITNGQYLTWGTTMYTMQFDSLTLS